MDRSLSLKPAWLTANSKLSELWSGTLSQTTNKNKSKINISSCSGWYPLARCDVHYIAELSPEFTEKLALEAMLQPIPTPFQTQSCLSQNVLQDFLTGDGSVPLWQAEENSNADQDKEQQCRPSKSTMSWRITARRDHCLPCDREVPGAGTEHSNWESPNLPSLFLLDVLVPNWTMFHYSSVHLPFLQLSLDTDSFTLAGYTLNKPTHSTLKGCLSETILWPAGSNWTERFWPRPQDDEF